MEEMDPVLDLQRLRAVARYDLASTSRRALLDDYARRAAKILDWPLGLVSIVLDDAQWFAGAHGVAGWLADAGGTPVEWSFCASVVRTGTQLCVEDARESRFRDNPLVCHDGVTAYAGVPLTTADGHVLGSLCSISSKSASIPDEKMRSLQELARELMAALQDAAVQ